MTTSSNLICPLYKQALIAHTDHENLKVWNYIVNDEGDEIIRGLIKCDGNDCEWWSPDSCACSRTNRRRC